MGLEADAKNGLQQGEISIDAASLFGELGDQALAVELDAGGDAKLKIGKNEGVKALGIELGEIDLGAKLGEQRRDASAGLGLADVVEADVEVIGTLRGLATKLGGAASGDIVGLETGDGQASTREIGPSGQPAEPGTDDCHIHRGRGLLTDTPTGRWIVGSWRLGIGIGQDGREGVRHGGPWVRASAEGDKPLEEMQVMEFDRRGLHLQASCQRLGGCGSFSLGS